MNANELADELENTSMEQKHYDTMQQAATMLRQQQAEIEKWTDQYQRLNENLEMWKAGHFKQQAEIEALKQIIDANNLNQNIGQFVKPTNEPVAYRYEDKSNPLVFYFTTRKDKTENPDAIEIPLYTHPVKELDEQFEKGFKAGKEEGWKAHKFYHPVKEQDESFDRTASHMAGEYVSYKAELTDEEIYKIASQIEAIQPQHGLRLSNDLNVMDFARAILRKASEK